MENHEVWAALRAVGKARREWATAQTAFVSNVEAVMARLLNEAAVNRVSDHEVAMLTGFTVKRVRMMMREQGLNPKSGRTLMAKHAAETLASNAALLGVEPKEMDLTSPLAYLPAGSALRKETLSVSQVEIEEMNCPECGVVIEVIR